MIVSYASPYALAAFGGEILPPTGFQWPTEARYAADLIKAVHTMLPDIGVSPGSGGIISAPIQTHVTGLVGTLESSADEPMGALLALSNNISLLAQGGTAPQIVNAVNDVLQSAIDITSMTLEALDVAADIVGVVPIVGQIVGAVFGIIGALLALPSRRTSADDCIKKLEAELGPMCKRTWDESNKVLWTGFPKTWQGDINASPADWFRPLAYRYWQGSKNYPANVSTMLLMLCGGAAGDFGISESRYQEIVESIRRGSIKVGPKTASVPRNAHVGLSRKTRDKMWLLMRAVMSSVQNPQAPRPEMKGDQGRAAMAMMTEILRVAADLDEVRHKKQIDNELLRQLGNEAFAWTARKRICSPATPLTRELAAYGSCRQEFVPALTEQLTAMLHTLNHKLYYVFGVGTGATRRLSPRPKKNIGFSTQAAGARGVLSFSPKTVKTMSDMEKKIAAGEHGQNKAALWTTAVIVGGGAFALARRVAKK